MIKNHVHAFAWHQPLVPLPRNLFTHNISPRAGAHDSSVPAFNPYLANWSGTAHALLIFVICMVVVMLPKLLSLIDLARDRQRCQSFGGLGHATFGVVGETVFSTLTPQCSCSGTRASS